MSASTASAAIRTVRKTGCRGPSRRRTATTHANGVATISPRATSLNVCERIRIGVESAIQIASPSTTIATPTSSRARSPSGGPVRVHQATTAAATTPSGAQISTHA